MLILTRHVDEEIIIRVDNKEVARIKVLEIRGQRTRIGCTGNAATFVRAELEATDGETKD